VDADPVAWAVNPFILCGRPGRDPPSRDRGELVFDKADWPPACCRTRSQGFRLVFFSGRLSSLEKVHEKLAPCSSPSRLQNSQLAPSIENTPSFISRKEVPANYVAPFVLFFKLRNIQHTHRGLVHTNTRHSGRYVKSEIYI
jgi:hypothetical protein